MKRPINVNNDECAANKTMCSGDAVNKGMCSGDAVNKAMSSGDAVNKTMCRSEAMPRPGNEKSRISQLMHQICQACVLSAALTYVFCLPPAGAEETTAEQQSELAPISSMTKAEYESEAIALATWKSKVQGTHMGDKLIDFLTTLNTNIVRNGRDTNSLYNRGYLYGTVGCTKAAVVDLTKAIEADPMSAKLYCERGICYLDLADYARAQVDLNMAIHLNLASGDARLARGRLYLALNRPDKALVDLLAAKEPQMEFSPALPGELPSNFYKAPDYYLGTCYEMLGEYDLALRSFREAAKDVTGADSGYIHRYADRPVDAAERANKLRSG